MNLGDSHLAGKIELPIPDRDIGRVLECASVIQSLFNVGVSASGSQTSRGEWVTLRGKQENLAKAKKFLQAMCNPELRVEACRSPEFARLLFSEHSRMRHELEREYQTVLSRDPQSGSVLVQGSEVDVYAAVDKLRSLMSRPYPVATIAAPTNHPATTMSRDTDRFLCALPIDLKQRIFDTLNPAHHVPPNSVIPRGSGDPLKESRIKYFVDLGYSREKVEEVLLNLPSAPDDVILNRLVQCTPAKWPRSEGEVHMGPTVEPPPAKPVNPELLRHVVIDGSNVAMRHGNGQVFSCRGIQLAVEYFKKRGHTNITVFVPEWRKEASTPDSPITDQHILHQLEQLGHLKYTPSRRLDGGRRIVCYDDRYIVKLAADEVGVIVSNDQFRDLVKEKAEWKEQIETRLLQFTFVNDYFMPPDDPLGRNGPSLDQLLSKDPHVTSQPSRPSKKVSSAHAGPNQICPHLERCTFGRKCKYYHPERDQTSSSGSTGSHTPSTSRSPTPSPSPDKRYMLNRSKEDLHSGYHDNPQSNVSLRELNDHLGGLSLHNKPDPPQFINLQPRLEAYSREVMRSTPSLPTPQNSGMLAPPDSVYGDRRPIHHTFPLMNLSSTPHGFVERPRPHTEDFTLHPSHSAHLTAPPSHPHRSHTQEHDYIYERKHLSTPQQLSGFPGPHPHGPHPHGNYQGGLLTRDGHKSDLYSASVSPHHYACPPTTHSHSYPQIPPSSSNSLPHRSRTASEGYRGNQHYNLRLFEQALAVLPGCEDRLHRVFARYPGISTLEEVIEQARTID